MYWPSAAADAHFSRQIPSDRVTTSYFGGRRPALVEVFKAALILAELFPESPRRPQHEIQMRGPGLGVRLRDPRW